MEKFLDFDPARPNGAIMANNYDWFSNMNFLQFIRDVGKHITVNYMMAKDSVKNRLEGDTGMSFTEFTYQLVQGYDFYWLYTKMNCVLQMGGSDQWGNIVTGTELIRKKWVVTLLHLHVRLLHVPMEVNSERLKKEIYGWTLIKQLLTSFTSSG